MKDSNKQGTQEQKKIRMTEEAMQADKVEMRRSILKLSLLLLMGDVIALVLMWYNDVAFTLQVNLALFAVFVLQIIVIFQVRAMFLEDKAPYLELAEKLRVYDGGSFSAPQGRGMAHEIGELVADVIDLRDRMERKTLRQEREKTLRATHKELTQYTLARVYPGNVEDFMERYHVVFGQLISQDTRYETQLYDYFPIGEEKMAIVMGAVNGGGFSKAIYLAKVQALLRGAMQFGDLNSVAAYVSGELYRSYQEDNINLRLFVAIFDGKNEDIIYLAADYPAPLLFERKGGVSELSVKKQPRFGTYDLYAYQWERTPISRGDRLVFSPRMDALQHLNEQTRQTADELLQSAHLQAQIPDMLQMVKEAIALDRASEAESGSPISLFGFEYCLSEAEEEIRLMPQPNALTKCMALMKDQMQDFLWEKARIAQVCVAIEESFAMLCKNTRDSIKLSWFFARNGSNFSVNFGCNLRHRNPFTQEDSDTKSLEQFLSRCSQEFHFLSSDTGDVLRLFFGKYPVSVGVSSSEEKEDEES